MRWISLVLVAGCSVPTTWREYCADNAAAQCKEERRCSPASFDETYADMNECRSVYSVVCCSFADDCDMPVTVKSTDAEYFDCLADVSRGNDCAVSEDCSLLLEF